MSSCSLCLTIVGTASGGYCFGIPSKWRCRRIIRSRPGGGRPRTTAVRGIAAPHRGALSARARARSMPAGRKAAVGAGRGYQSAHPGADGGQRVGRHPDAPACHRRGDSQRNGTHCSTHYRGTTEPGNRPRLAPRNRASTRIRAPSIRADAACRGTPSPLNRFSHLMSEKLLVLPITAPHPCSAVEMKGAENEPDELHAY